MNAKSVPLNEPVVTALRELREGLAQRFGERLKVVRLFGSRARGDARQESDADVVVVLDAVTRADFVAILDLCGDLLVAHDLIVDPFITSEEEYHRHREQERPLALDIERDGITL